MPRSEIDPSAPTLAPSSDSAEIQAWRKLAALWLEAVGKRPVQFCAAERATFAGRVEESLEALRNDAEASQILVTAGSVSEAVVRYNSHTQLRFDELIDRFRALVRVLVERDPRLSEALKQNVEPLLAAQDLPDVQAKLALCLEAYKALDNPGNGSAVNASTAPPSTDPNTGLPTRDAAAVAIQNALTAGNQVYLATFYLHRMNLINARFGDSIGNQVILFCSQHIATHLTRGNDALFRWYGPGFVALLERSDSALSVANELQRFTAMPLSRFFETPSRTVYLPIKLTGEVLPIAGRRFDELLEQVQASLHGLGGTGI